MCDAALAEGMVASCSRTATETSYVLEYRGKTGTLAQCQVSLDPAGVARHCHTGIWEMAAGF